MHYNVWLWLMAILFAFMPIAGVGHADDEIPPVIRYELYSFRASETHSVIFTHAEHAGGYRFSVVVCGLGNGGNSSVGLGAYMQTEGHFTFESLNPTEIKDRTRGQLLPSLQSDSRSI